MLLNFATEVGWDSYRHNFDTRCIYLDNFIGHVSIRKNKLDTNKNLNESGISMKFTFNQLS